MTQTIDQKARELLARQLEIGLYHDDAERVRAAQDGLGVICAASALAALTEALTRLEELEAKLEIRKANRETPRYVVAAQEPDDLLYPKALELLADNEYISCSMIQRALQIGFNRACGFLEKMEAAGIIDRHEGDGKYKVRVRRTTLSKGITE